MGNIKYDQRFKKTNIILDQYIEDLDNYTEEEFQRKPDEKSWSIGQVYEHLVSSSENYFSYKVNNCLVKEKGTEDAGLTEIGEQLFERGSFPPVKIDTPRAIKPPNPPEAKSKEFYKQKLEELKKHWEKLNPLVEANDGNFKTKHPVFGFMNAQEWCQMNEMHFRHHLLQIGRLKAFLGQS